MAGWQTDPVPARADLRQSPSGGPCWPKGLIKGLGPASESRLGSGPGQGWRETDRTATAAAIGRVVHHSVILEFDVPSYRTDAAQQRGQAEEVNRQE